MNSYHAPVQFKHHHKKRRYGKKKLRINLTVLFIAVFIIACVIGAVLLGNHLKNKLENMPSDSTGTSDASAGTATDDDFSSVSDAALAGKAHRSGCCVIGKGDAARVFDSGYDSVVIPLTDKDGALMYDSAAAQALSRQPSDNGLPDLSDLISEIRAAADARGIVPTVTVYYDMVYSKASDPMISEATLLYETAVIAEAFSAGADEALITGLPVVGSSVRDPEAILSVIDKLRTSAPLMKITVALPYEVFADRDNSQALDSIASAAGALAVDARPLDWSYSESEEDFTHTDENGETVTDKQLVRHTAIFGEIDRISTEIRSSIQLYGLSFVLYGDVLYNEKEAVDALVKNGTYSYYVVTCPDDPTAPPSDDTSSDSGSDSDVEPPTDRPTERPTERPTRPETEPPTESQTAPVTEPETEPVTTPGTETETAPPTEPSSEPETQPVTEPQTEPATEPATEPVTEPETEPETTSEPVPEPEPEPEPDPSDAPDTVGPAEI